MFRCSLCREYKVASEFTPSAQQKSGVSSHCKKCRNARSKARWSYETNRDWQLRSNYGITLAEYNAMLEAQGGVCDICKEPAKMQYFGPGGTICNCALPLTGQGEPSGFFVPPEPATSATLTLPSPVSPPPLATSDCCVAGTSSYSTFITLRRRSRVFLQVVGLEFGG